MKEAVSSGLLSPRHQYQTMSEPFWKALSCSSDSSHPSPSTIPQETHSSDSKLWRMQREKDPSCYPFPPGHLCPERGQTWLLIICKETHWIPIWSFSIMPDWNWVILRWDWTLHYLEKDDSFIIWVTRNNMETLKFYPRAGLSKFIEWLCRSSTEKMCLVSACS